MQDMSFLRKLRIQKNSPWIPVPFPGAPGFRAGCETAMVDDAYVAEDMYNDRLAYIYDYGEAVPTEALQLLMARN